jgi:hypothetical protein
MSKIQLSIEEPEASEIITAYGIYADKLPLSFTVALNRSNGYRFVRAVDLTQTNQQGCFSFYTFGYQHPNFELFWYLIANKSYSFESSQKSSASLFGSDEELQSEWLSLRETFDFFLWHEAGIHRPAQDLEVLTSLRSMPSVRAVQELNGKAKTKILNQIPYEYGF